MIVARAESAMVNVIRDTMHDEFGMLFVELMTSLPLLDVISTLESSTVSCVKRGGPVSVAAAHTVTDRIKDHKLVFVVRNQNLFELGSKVKS
jgi:hypothetical protein